MDKKTFDSLPEEDGEEHTPMNMRWWKIVCVLAFLATTWLLVMAVIEAGNPKVRREPSGKQPSTSSVIRPLAEVPKNAVEAPVPSTPRQGEKRYRQSIKDDGLNRSLPPPKLP